MKFFRVIRPYCYPGVCFTFSDTNKNAIAKINKNHGFCTGTTARQIQKEEMKTIIINVK